ncbi:hypothetical protein ACT009_14945 [Sphingomonas sp. Tas61C01]|uniref:hypothetical protein n=1 Tax=Sphingomonas sp. Tas61C01 TaxID=3458297 RepID=UPI00403E3ACD
MMDKDEVISLERASADGAYFSERAAWHQHRATQATDDSTRLLHERFAALYRWRADPCHAA